MDKREQAVRTWFEMWLQGSDVGVEALFAPHAVYIESWGPEYHGRDKIHHWFQEWNTWGRVLQWDIKQLFHKEDQTVVEWYFKSCMNGGRVEAFDGMSLIRWTAEGRICFLQEFGCNENRYDPYQNGPVPQFRDEKALWF